MSMTSSRGSLPELLWNVAGTHPERRDCPALPAKRAQPTAGVRLQFIGEHPALPVARRTPFPISFGMQDTRRPAPADRHPGSRPRLLLPSKSKTRGSLPRVEVRLVLSSPHHGYWQRRSRLLRKQPARLAPWIHARSTPSPRSAAALDASPVHSWPKDARGTRLHSGRQEVTRRQLLAAAGRYGGAERTELRCPSALLLRPTPVDSTPRWTRRLARVPGPAGSTPHARVSEGTSPPRKRRSGITAQPLLLLAAIAPARAASFTLCSARCARTRAQLRPHACAATCTRLARDWPPAPPELGSLYSAPVPLTLRWRDETAMLSSQSGALLSARPTARAPVLHSPCVDDSSTLRDGVSWCWGAPSPHLVSVSTTHGAPSTLRAEPHAAAATRDFTQALGGGAPHLVAPGHTLKLHDAHHPRLRLPRYTPRTTARRRLSKCCAASQCTTVGVRFPRVFRSRPLTSHIAARAFAQGTCACARVVRAPAIPTIRLRCRSRPLTCPESTLKACTPTCRPPPHVDPIRTHLGGHTTSEEAQASPPPLPLLLFGDLAVSAPTRTHNTSWARSAAFSTPQCARTPHHLPCALAHRARRTTLADTKRAFARLISSGFERRPLWFVRASGYLALPLDSTPPPATGRPRPDLPELGQSQFDAHALTSHARLEAQPQGQEILHVQDLCPKRPFFLPLCPLTWCVSIDAAPNCRWPRLRVAPERGFRTASVRTELVVCARWDETRISARREFVCAPLSALPSGGRHVHRTSPVTARKRPALPVCAQGRSLCAQGCYPLALIRALDPSLAHSRRVLHLRGSAAVRSHLALATARLCTPSWRPCHRPGVPILRVVIRTRGGTVLISGGLACAAGRLTSTVAGVKACGAFCLPGVEKTGGQLAFSGGTEPARLSLRLQISFFCLAGALQRTTLASRFLTPEGAASSVPLPPWSTLHPGCVHFATSEYWSLATCHWVQRRAPQRVPTVYATICKRPRSLVGGDAASSMELERYPRPPLETLALRVAATVALSPSRFGAPCTSPLVTGRDPPHLTVRAHDCARNGV
ncbi:hypothetical protein B0H14DRAFT_3876582 [Mycena olivaceomarginata]|nr:hypothetical protein B0H14DRAFT_3876582 [Mycena olivaceomarginata]